MEKPRFITEERRNGVYAVVFGGRFALPSWFVAAILLLGVVATVVLCVVGGFLGNFAMKVPLIVLAGGFILWLIGAGVYKLVKQIILVNDKSLTSDRD